MSYFQMDFQINIPFEKLLEQIKMVKHDLLYISL